MTGDSSVMAKSPDQSAISRGLHRISASLMPHGAAYELAYIGAALASILAELPLVAGALTLVPRQLVPFACANCAALVATSTQSTSTDVRGDM